jgi:hypothetical protein
VEGITMSEPTADPLELLTKRLDAMEKTASLHEKHRDEYFADSFRHRADTQALLSMMREMAAHLGLSEDHIEECFSERARFYHDEILRIFENTDPLIAGLADDRHLAELPEKESFLPLFDDDPPKDGE